MNSCPPILWRAVVATVLLVLSGAVMAQQREYPQFQAMWQNLVDESVAVYRQDFAADEFAGLAEDEREQALAELEQLMRARVGWDAVGSQVVANFLEACGEDKLQRLQALSGEGTLAESEHAEFRKAIQACFADAMQRNMEMLSLRLLGDHLDDLDELKARYDIAKETPADES